MKVFLDMDGVLADFFTEAVKLSDSPNKHWSDLDYRDVKRVLNKIVSDHPYFFLDLKPFPTTKTFVQCVHNLAGGFSILSSPLSGYADCEKQKILWLSKHLHLDPDEIIITDDKPSHAEGNVLIDDYGYNIRKWEAAGGFGIKYQADEQHMNEALVPLQILYKGL